MIAAALVVGLHAHRRFIGLYVTSRQQFALYCPRNRNEQLAHPHHCVVSIEMLARGSGDTCLTVSSSFNRRERTPFPVIKFELVNLVVEQERVTKVDGMFLRDGLDCCWRIEEPPVIVLPIVHVVSEVVVHATADGIDVESQRHLHRPQPFGTLRHPLRHLARGDHRKESIDSGSWVCGRPVNNHPWCNFGSSVKAPTGTKRIVTKRVRVARTGHRLHISFRSTAENLPTRASER